MSRRSWALLAACGLAGCTPASPASLQNAAAVLHPACGPADEATVMLEVPATAAEYPRFRLRVWGQLGDAAGRTVHAPAAEYGHAQADWCVTAADCREVRTATATFASIRADSSVAARVRAVRPDGAPFAWSGIAAWHGQTQLCG